MAGVSAYDVSGTVQSTPLDISTSAASVTVTEQGNYVFWTDVECYVYIGSAHDPVVTADRGWILYTGSKTLPVAIKKNQVIQAITETGTGTLRYIKVGVLR